MRGWSPLLLLFLLHLRCSHSASCYDFSRNGVAFSYVTLGDTHDRTVSCSAEQFCKIVWKGSSVQSLTSFTLGVGSLNRSALDLSRLIKYTENSVTYYVDIDGSGEKISAYCIPNPDDVKPCNALPATHFTILRAKAFSITPEPSLPRPGMTSRDIARYEKEVSAAQANRRAAENGLPTTRRKSPNYEIEQNTPISVNVGSSQQEALSTGKDAAAISLHGTTFIFLIMLFL